MPGRRCGDCRQIEGQGQCACRAGPQSERRVKTRPDDEPESGTVHFQRELYSVAEMI